MKFRFKLGIRFKLIIAFVLAISLPIGALIGFYSLSLKYTTENTMAKFLMPAFVGDLAEQVGKAYAGGGSLEDAVMVLEKVDLPPGGRIELLDREGRIVYDTSRSSEGNIILPADMARMLTYPDNTIPRDQLKHHTSYVAAPVTAAGTDSGLVLLSYPMNVALEPLLKSIWLTGLAGLISALLVIFLLGWVLSRGIIFPLKNLVEATEKISRGDFEARVEVKSKDELGRLGSAFNSMVEELNKAREREKALELSRRELVASVSHDLRTPLSSIRGYVEGLLDGVASEPEKTRRYLGVIHDKAISLDRLINDLFELSRLEAGQLKMEFVTVNSGEMLEEMCETFKGDAAVAGLSFSYYATSYLPLVQADPGRIEQVMTNLLHNSFRHTPPGGEVVVKAVAAGDEVLISVQDSGEGIAPGDLPYVFERLYTGEKSRSRVKGGTGLGLAIAREIIQAHGGRIWVESEEGRGSTFYITISSIK